MSKVEWGVKRRCASCGAPFYDMQRDPIRCPKCDAPFVAVALASASTRAPRQSRVPRPYVPASIDPSPVEAGDAEVETVEDEELETDADEEDVADDEDGVEADDADDERAKS